MAVVIPRMRATLNGCEILVQQDTGGAVAYVKEVWKRHGWQAGGEPTDSIYSWLTVDGPSIADCRAKLETDTGLDFSKCEMVTKIQTVANQENPFNSKVIVHGEEFIVYGNQVGQDWVVAATYKGYPLSKKSRHFSDAVRQWKEAAELIGDT